MKEKHGGLSDSYAVFAFVLFLLSVSDTSIYRDVFGSIIQWLITVHTMIIKSSN